jgi:hypothetical protein
MYHPNVVIRIIRFMLPFNNSISFRFRYAVRAFDYHSAFPQLLNIDYLTLT